MKIACRTLEQAKRAAAELARQWQASNGTGIMVTIESLYRPGTRSQKAKIHVLLAEMATHLGYDNYELKEICKRQYWPQKEVRLKKTSITIPKSTGELTKEEASAVIEQLLKICAEMNIPTKETNHDD